MFVKQLVNRFNLCHYNYIESEIEIISYLRRSDSDHAQAMVHDGQLFLQFNISKQLPTYH